MTLIQHLVTVLVMTISTVVSGTLLYSCTDGSKDATEYECTQIETSEEYYGENCDK